MSVSNGHLLAIFIFFQCATCLSPESPSTVKPYQPLSPLLIYFHPGVCIPNFVFVTSRSFFSLSSVVSVWWWDSVTFPPVGASIWYDLQRQIYHLWRILFLENVPIWGEFRKSKTFSLLGRRLGWNLINLWKMPWRRKWQPTPVFLPGGSHEQRAIVHGVAKCQTGLNTHTHCIMRRDCGCALEFCIQSCFKGVICLVWIEC